ncbi:MAG: hypothetical protein H0V44_06845 [Planctomycetes bacterium]|nr:hypothetical protein [Planctomycetota bacterium]
MSHVEQDQLRRSILLALAQAGEQDLAAIHTLLNRPQKDVSLLPVVGGLVAGGFLEKVSTPRPSPFPNAPVASTPGRRSSQPIPVRFRLTDEGRKLVKEAAEQAFQHQAELLAGVDAETSPDAEDDSEPEA